VKPIKTELLIITRGSKIMAEGTAANPIIFTSEKPSPKEETGQVL
jgi:hypothetical protein